MTATMTFAGLDVHARSTHAAAIEVRSGELRRARFGAGSEEELFTITLEEALVKLAQPRQRGRRAAAPPLKELGADPVSGKPVTLKEGRFGPYVTDGETNASLRTGDSVDAITPERAYELLQIRREAGPPKRRRRKG